LSTVVGEPLVATRDLEEAQHHITEVYIPHGLTSRDGRPLDFTLRYWASQRITLGHLQYGADAELLVPAMESCYHVNLTLEGMTQVGQGGRTAVTESTRSGVVFNPVEPFTVRWSPEALQYAIKVPRGSLEGQLSALVGRPVERPIRVGLGFDLTQPHGQSLLASVHHLRDELARPGGLAQASPLILAQLESYVLSQMLLTMQHEYSDLLRQPPDTIRRRHVRVAMDYIQEHAREPITGPDVARAACVSTRSLQVGFQEELGMSPMAYLREIRLERVHADLLDGASVSEVANRWGFHHLGRFAGQYRRKFGALPSEMVRRRS
jgi:AraC-like DNA-binding protein